LVLVYFDVNDGGKIAEYANKIPVNLIQSHSVFSYGFAYYFPNNTYRHEWCKFPCNARYFVSKICDGKQVLEKSGYCLYLVAN
jgi:hypothetical protein